MNQVLNPLGMTGDTGRTHFADDATLDYIHRIERQLAEKTNAIEEAQARIAQLEEALRMMLEAGESEYGEDWFVAAMAGRQAISESASDWLARHDAKKSNEVIDGILSSFDYFYSPDGKWLSDEIRAMKTKEE